MENRNQYGPRKKKEISNERVEFVHRVAEDLRDVIDKFSKKISSVHRPLIHPLQWVTFFLKLRVCFLKDRKERKPPLLIISNFYNQTLQENVGRPCPVSTNAEGKSKSIKSSKSDNDSSKKTKQEIPSFVRASCV